MVGPDATEEYLETTRSVSVVICAYTMARWSALGAAVRSVGEQTVPVGEIIVVVDHNDELLVHARTHLDGVRVVENTQNRGLGGARNSGVAAATGDIVAFLDDDAVATPEWIEELLWPFDRDSAVLGVGGAIEARCPTGRSAWFPREFDWVIGCTYEGMPKTVAPVRNMHGCNMAFRRGVFESIGAFALGYGCDETEFCIRVARSWPGGQFLHNPRARVQHYVPPERMNWRYFLRRCYFEGGSKAVVAWLQGATEGLSSERAYVLHALPRGIVRGIVDGLIRGEIHGLLRALAIFLGLTATMAGYVMGKARLRHTAVKRGWVEHSTTGASR